jgi:hypothetical protein
MVLDALWVKVGPLLRARGRQAGGPLDLRRFTAS